MLIYLKYTKIFSKSRNVGKYLTWLYKMQFFEEAGESKKFILLLTSLDLFRHYKIILEFNSETQILVVAFTPPT